MCFYVSLLLSPLHVPQNFQKEHGKRTLKRASRYVNTVYIYPDGGWCLTARCQKCDDTTTKNTRKPRNQNVKKLRCHTRRHHHRKNTTVLYTHRVPTNLRPNKTSHTANIRKTKHGMRPNMSRSTVQCKILESYSSHPNCMHLLFCRSMIRPLAPNITCSVYIK